MRATRLAVIVLGLALLGQVACGQDGDLLVGEVGIPSWEWGTQKVQLEVVNNSAMPMFIIAETDLQFTGEYLNPSRKAYTNYALAPGEAATLEPLLIIPGNFGRAEIVIRLYNVVDTMDLILADHLAFEQTFSITYRLTDGLVSYFQDQVVLPSRIEDNQDFDNEFARVMLLLIEEGRTIAEMAQLAECDTGFVRTNFQKCLSRGYVQVDSAGTRLTFPIITPDEAQQGVRLANEIGDSLANLIAGRLGQYRRTLDSMITAGSVPRDSNTFIHGGTVLHHSYPVIGGLALWWDLGKKFITPGGQLDIYRGNDLCRAYTPTFMFAVRGRRSMIGSQFYAATNNGPKIYFGDQLPVIICQDPFQQGRRTGRTGWQHDPEWVPETFMADAAVIGPAVGVLTRPADPLLASATDKLQALATSFGRGRIGQPYKYWFWNLTSTRALKTLVESGAVTPRGNGQYRFDGLNRKPVK